MLPLSKEQEKNPGDFGVVDNFRCGTYSLSFVARKILGMAGERRTLDHISPRLLWLFESRPVA